MIVCGCNFITRDIMNQFQKLIDDNVQSSVAKFTGDSPVISNIEKLSSTVVKTKDNVFDFTYFYNGFAMFNASLFLTGENKVCSIVKHYV